MLRNVSLLKRDLFGHLSNNYSMSAEKFWSNAQNYPVKFEENDQELVVHILAPGFSLDQLSVTTKENTIRIESTKDKLIYDFRKVINIPNMYDITTTDALLLNGILTISFQKLKSALPNKVIIRNEQITK
jgi:HSP20 family molecular chaperone IbpA